MQNSVKTALFAAISVALFSPTADAATYNNGDLLLGLRASGGQGANTSYVLNLGPALTFRNAAAGSSVTLSLGNIAADLAATYGGTWFARADLSWGVVAGVDTLQGIPAGEGGNALYASRAQTPIGVFATPYDRRSNSNQSATITSINTMVGEYVAGTATGNSNGKGVLQTGSSQWATFMPDENDLLAFEAWESFEGNFGNGTAGTALDLFRMATSSNNPPLPGTYEGTFTIDNAGAVTFSNVPEPSTAAIMIAAAGLLGFARRRRAVVA